MEAFNIKFVSEIEKHPELYNFSISEYSRRDCQDKAWYDVFNEVNLSGKLIYYNKCYFYFYILIIYLFLFLFIRIIDFICKLNIYIYNYNPQNTLNTLQIFNIIKILHSSFNFLSN